MTLAAALSKTMASVGIVKEDGLGKPVFISSGSMGLDLALGGGLPRGQLTTIASSIPGYGKDTLVNLFIKNITTAPKGAMLNGGKVLIYNQERKMRSDWLLKMGANLDKVDIVHAKSGEFMFADILKNILEDNYDLIVVNSVTATSFTAEIEAVMAVKKESEEEDGDGNKKAKSGGFDKAFVALAAKHWSFFRKILTNPLADSNVAFVTINQSSAVIGASYPMAETEYAGKSLLAWASLRLNLLAPKIVKSTDPSTGEIVDTLTIRVNLLKNTFMTRRIMGTEVILVNGILNSVADVVKFGKEYGSFQKEDGTTAKAGGKWYYDGVYLGKNEAEVKQYLLTHPDVYGKIYAQVSALAASTPLPDSSELYASNDTETNAHTN